MEHLTVDGRFTKIYNYHFAILNHFHHGAKISLPFYLASSLNESLTDYAKNPNSYPIAHKGLILLIFEHLKDKARATKDDPLITNSHIPESCKDFDLDEDQPNAPTHKKRRVEIEHEEMEVHCEVEEEKGKDIEIEMEYEKDDNIGKEDEGDNFENPHSTPMGLDGKNVAPNSKEDDNPNSVGTEQGRDSTNTILNTARNYTLECFNFLKWVVDNITSMQSK